MPIHKLATAFSPDYETALVVYQGRLLAISFVRGWTDPFANSIRVRDFFTTEVLATKPWNGGLGAAIVVDGQIRIFGSTNWGTPGNKIITAVLGTDFTPGPATTVLQCPSNVTVFNCDVANGPLGYVMAYEATDTVRGGNGCYFMKSPDLVTWQKFGNQFRPGHYTACPAMSYTNGYYYIDYLGHTGSSTPPNQHHTWMARTVDFQTYQYSTKTLLAPNGDEGSSASDTSIAEFNGWTYAAYLASDQVTTGHSRTAIYPRDLASLRAVAFS